MEKYVVIMAGGVGSRFWPRSRKKTPKQLINIFGKNSMIRDTYERVLDFTKPENIIIVTNKVQKALIEEQIPELPENNVIAEPVGRNTAPCVALAARLIYNKQKDAVIVTLPADHLIQDKSRFTETLEKASKFAWENKGLVTFGIIPTRPETGYGYINFNEEETAENIHKVEKFVEKPDLRTAEEYLWSGNYLWNSGMFVWRADVILNELAKYQDEIFRLTDREDLIKGEDVSSPVKEIYSQIPSISVDYAIMEKSDKVFLIKADFDWSDVGSWETVYEISDKDANGNSYKGDVYLDNTKNSYIWSPDKFTAVLGVEELLIINTSDALLVGTRKNAQDVKKIVDHLNEKGKTDLT